MIFAFYIDFILKQSVRGFFDSALCVVRAWTAPSQITHKQAAGMRHASCDVKDWWTVVNTRAMVDPSKPSKTDRTYKFDIKSTENVETKSAF